MTHAILSPAPVSRREAAYAAWMRRVNAALEALSGMSVEELPDWPYREAFDQGELAHDVALDVLDALDEDEYDEHGF